MKLTARMMNTLGMKSRSGDYINLAFLMSDIVVKLAEYDSDELQDKEKLLRIIGKDSF